MKEDFDKILEVAVSSKDVNYFGKEVKSLINKYGVSEKTVYNRFKSVYGKSPRDYIKDAVWPSQLTMDSVVMASSTSEEVRSALSLPNSLFNGIYDKFYGVSSFTKAKEKLLMSVPAKVRSNTFREDNVSILMSQYLGDGSYDPKRHALRIVHGHKQAEYLRWKVSLIYEGYNKVYTKVTQNLHSQGHTYFSWYSGKLGNVDFPAIKEDAVGLLTPIGWLLLYLDDGCYGQDIFITTESESLAVAMQKELKTYGIDSRVNKCSSSPTAHNVTMCGGKNTIGFYKNFIEPYEGIIPKCMSYKTQMKI